MLKRRRSPITQAQSCQVLEDRALLSATLSEGVLTLEGTAENDVLRVGIHPEDDTVMVAKVNGETFEFNAADVTGIQASGGPGADYIQIGKRVRVPSELRGGEGPDRLIGGVRGDTLLGGPGHDRMSGGLGSDLLSGGEDGDKMNGGVGSDTLLGGDGNDRMVGHFGADLMFGGPGNDGMNGGRGDDVMAGQDGNDAMHGGHGDDDMSGGAGNDRMAAGGGSDMLFGGIGDDTLSGNSNHDILHGGPGGDTIHDSSQSGPGNGGDFNARRRAKRIFKRLDSNKDRVLTSDEVAEDRFAELLEFDADESGDIVFTEFFEWFKDKTGRGD